MAANIEIDVGITAGLKVFPKNHKIRIGNKLVREVPEVKDPYISFNEIRRLGSDFVAIEMRTKSGYVDRELVKNQGSVDFKIRAAKREMMTRYRVLRGIEQEGDSP